MTAAHDCPLCANAAALWQAAERGELPEAAWDEGLEQQIAYAAETFDPETGRSRPLGPRRTA